jgi:hypothetical protein
MTARFNGSRIADRGSRNNIRNSSLFRRNLFTALALMFLMIPLIPYVQEERIGWFMWRDAPVLAVTFYALAAVMIIGWLRTPRD